MTCSPFSFSYSFLLHTFLCRLDTTTAAFAFLSLFPFSSSVSSSLFFGLVLFSSLLLPLFSPTRYTFRRRSLSLISRQSPRTHLALLHGFSARTSPRPRNTKERRRREPPLLYAAAIRPTPLKSHDQTGHIKRSFFLRSEAIEDSTYPAAFSLLSLLFSCLYFHLSHLAAEQGKRRQTNNLKNRTHRTPGLHTIYPETGFCSGLSRKSRRP